MTLSCSSTVLARTARPNGKIFGSAFQSHGPNATSVADAPGSDARSTPTGGIVDGGSQRFTMPAMCLRVGGGLAYASQQEPVPERGITTARKIQMRLGGGESVTGAFPEKPKGM
jgi:hypothetical protein